MSRPRQQTADPVTPDDRSRERDPLATGSAFDLDDSVAPLDESRAPMGTHEVPPPREDQTKIESPGARHRTPPPPSKAHTTPPPAPRKERAGDRVGAVLGSYRLLELIGKGGMGYVYRAEHVKLGREVALKVLRIDYARRRDSVARFFQEARTVNRIRHRNIVDVTDFIELDDGTTFIIMEMLRGESLGRWARDRFDTPRALALLVQICDGLAAAHAVGVIHRDLKPDNVIIVPTGDGAEQIKLLDFGVAKLVHRDDEDFGLETAAGSVIGTPAYMSPEQAGGLVVDGRSDIYSLGAIMYELFCGVPMFRGRSFGEYVRKHLQERPVHPRDTARGAALDPRIEDIVLTCIEKDPARRYPTIEALRDDLLATLGGIETLDPGLAMPLPAPDESGIVVPSIALLATQPPRRAPEPATTPFLPPEIPTLPPPAAPSLRPRIGIWIGVATAATAVGIAAFVLAGGSKTAAPAATVAVPIPVPVPAPAPPAAKTTAPPAAKTTAPSIPTASPLPVPPARLPLVDLRFDSTPSADVLAEPGTPPLCATPCAITIDPNDGGRTDARVFTLHRDGYRDRAITVRLASPPPEIHATLARAGGTVSRPPRATSHAAATAPPTAGTPTPQSITSPAAPPPPTPPAHKDSGKGKGKVDSTQTIDPFH